MKISILLEIEINTDYFMRVENHRAQQYTHSFVYKSIQILIIVLMQLYVKKL